MRRFIALAGVVALGLSSAVTLIALAPADALAQRTTIPTGSRVARSAPAMASNSNLISDEENALRTTLAFAECVADRHEEELRPILTLKPHTLTEDEQDALSDGRCLSGANLRLPMQIIRGAVFRAFLFRDFADEEIVFAETPVDYYQEVDPNSYAGSLAGLLTFAACVVREDTDNSLSFISHRPGDASSDAALAALIPVLGPCMPAGVEVEFSKSTLIAFLSEALFWEAGKGRDSNLLSAAGGEMSE